MGAKLRKSAAQAKPAAKAKKRAVKASFAAVVRRVMAQALPAYRFVETSGGSGPLVTFARPAGPARPRLVEHVMFQKGLHGADWFRVSFFASLEGRVATGTSAHTLLDGAELGSDVRWKDDAALEAAVAAACAHVEAAAARYFAPFEKQYARFDALFGDLVAHYSAWLRAEGAQLPAAAFRDDGDGRLPAFEAFRAWLGRRKLTPRLPGDLETPLWRFWHSGRPMRESDYDPADYYDCTRCTAFVRRARARLVTSKLAGFGTHFALVCAKH